MLSATCHCGAVRVTVPARPRSITNCNCSICRRYGVLWAYYKPQAVRVQASDDSLNRYAWGAGTLWFVRCALCGCVMCWEPIAPRPAGRMGVNMRNFEPAALGPVRIRLLDGAGTERYIADTTRAGRRA